MLYNVSHGMQRIVNNVIATRPNTWSVQFVRKVVDRTAASSMGGIPTMGGLGVLDTQDEEAYHFEFLCNGYALRADQFQAGGMTMTDRQDATIGSAEDFLYLLAPEEIRPKPGEPPAPAVEIKSKDVVLFVLGDTSEAARLAYEVASVEPTMDMPPFLPRYVLQRRSALDIAAGAGP